MEPGTERQVRYTSSAGFAIGRPHVHVSVILEARGHVWILGPPSLRDERVKV